MQAPLRSSLRLAELQAARNPMPYLGASALIRLNDPEIALTMGGTYRGYKP